MTQYEVELHAKVTVWAERDDAAVTYAMETVTSSPWLLYPTDCIVNHDPVPRHYKTIPRPSV